MLAQLNVESDAESLRTVRPRTATGGGGGGDDDDEDKDETDASELAVDSDDDDDLVEAFDLLTERNREANARVPVPDADVPELDPLSEGVNVVITPELYFPTTLNAAPGRLMRRRTARRERGACPTAARDGAASVPVRLVHDRRAAWRPPAGRGGVLQSHLARSLISRVELVLEHCV